MDSSTILCVFIAAACSVAFVLSKSVMGNSGRSEEWWYLWAVAILFSGFAFSGSFHLLGRLFL